MRPQKNPSRTSSRRSKTNSPASSKAHHRSLNVPVELEIAQLPLPILEFGAPGHFTDQKTGLTQAGPFDMRFGAAHRTQVRVGLVGPSEMIEKAQRWYERCQSTIASGSENFA